jgi:ankyrin repeat protein
MLDDNREVANRSSNTSIKLTWVAIRSASPSTVKLILDRTNGKPCEPVLCSIALRAWERTEVAELVLNSGVPIDTVFSNGVNSRLERVTLLIHAASFGRVDLVRYLLSKGADTGIVSSMGRTALEVSQARRQYQTTRTLSEWNLRSGEMLGL